MHNPAWRPAQLNTTRLESIQHHFIDERPLYRSTPKPRIIHTLPVQMAVAAGHPADALQPCYLIDALTRQLNIQRSTGTELPEWQLEVIPPDHGAADIEQDFILVFATASLDGVRLAYTAIKKLFVTPSRSFGVLFSGARDEDFVNRCQERLESGARKFLGVRLHGFGHLSAPGPEFSASLARLAEEVHGRLGDHSIPKQEEVNNS